MQAFDQDVPDGNSLRTGSDAFGSTEDRVAELEAQIAEVIQKQPAGWREEKRRLKDELFRHKYRGSVAFGKRGRGDLPKDTVVASRVDAVDLDAIDTLVEAGIRATRSDAASWFIHEGVKAQQGLLDEVRQTVDEIRRLRAQAQERARQQAGGEPPAMPDGRSG